jgi:sugar lactone lactonase YvrE
LRLARTTGLALAALAAYLAFWPVSIEPTAWHPPTDPGFTGRYTPNEVLAGVDRLAEGVGHGPEDIEADGQGRLHVGYEDGRIVRFAPDGTGPEEIANTGGRPLGLRFDKDGVLWVADAKLGLLSVDPGGKVTVRVNEADGIPFRFTDHLDVAKDGRVLFTDASSKFGIGHHREDIAERGGHGRLMVFDPSTGAVETLLAGLHFANGVALAADDSFVLVNETASYRVLRHWLAGPRAGTTEPLIENRPGFPDYLSRGADGRFWIALAAPRSAALDAMGPHPFLRKLSLRLPLALQPQPARIGHVIAVDAKGEVLASLQGRDGRYAFITSAVEHAGHLYLGSLQQSAFGRLRLPSMAP